MGTALARGAGLPDLRGVWEKSAALEELLEPKSDTSLLSGESFREKIDDVLQHIGERTPTSEQRQEITLFMTATALDGRSRSYTDGYRNAFDLRDHRRLYRFRYQPEAVSYTKQGADWVFRTEPLDEFGKDNTAALVLAARATAGFPVAFSPVNEEPLVKYRQIPKPGYDDPASCVIDGGVLNNAPFQPVLEAITKRRLNAPVDRVVVFIVPSAGRLGPESTAGLKCDEISWSKVLWNAVRYLQEADFRSSTEELCAQLGNSIRDTQLDLFSRVAQDLDLAQHLRSRAVELLPEYRRNRARAVLYDVRRQLADAEAVTNLAATPEADADHIEAILAGLTQKANWVPTTAGAELTDPYDGGMWHWGLITCERALQCMSNHLHHRLADVSSPQRQHALISGAETISELTRRVLALFEAVDDQLQLRHPPGTDTGDETAARLIQEVFADLRVPEQLAWIARTGGQTYVDALEEADLPGWQRAEDVVAACLTVEVVTRAYASLSKVVERLVPESGGVVDPGKASDVQALAGACDC
ncbi:patatin-like phospholipase family protein [Streptomyces sp. NPDC001709]